MNDHQFPILCVTEGTSIPDNVSCLSTHDYLMKLFDYSDVDPDNVVFYNVDDNGDEFSIRAHFKKPVYHHTHERFRLCPNFPDIYISRDGSIIEEALIGAKIAMTVSKHEDIYVDYLETTVPCSFHRKFVTMFRIYADAWGNQYKISPTKHIPIPRDGDWRNYSTKNIRWVGRYQNQMLFETNTQARAYATPDSIFDIFGTPEDFVDKLDLQQNAGDDLRPYSFLPRLEVSESGTTTTVDVVSNLYGNNRDFCYHPFWFAFVVDGSTGEIYPCYSLGECISNARVCGATVSRNWLRKNLGRQSILQKS